MIQMKRYDTERPVNNSCKNGGDMIPQEQIFAHCLAG